MAKKMNEKTRKKFIKDFTAELVEAKKKELDENQKRAAEKSRIRKEIDIEKLRRKYVKKPEIMKPSSASKPMPAPKRVMPSQAFMPSAAIMPQMQRKKQMSAFDSPLYETAGSAPGALPMIIAPSVLNLGKIDSIIRDTAVTSVECTGPNKNLIIKKSGQTMKSNIKLKKTEIDTIVREFSEKARIPLVEGMLRARVANLQISAVISKVTASRFIITKIPGLEGSFVQRGQPGRVPGRAVGHAPGQFMPAVRRPFVSQAAQPQHPAFQSRQRQMPRK